jgi:hypothetical protein
MNYVANKKDILSSKQIKYMNKIIQF